MPLNFLPEFAGDVKTLVKETNPYYNIIVIQIVERTL